MNLKYLDYSTLHRPPTGLIFPAKRFSNNRRIESEHSRSTDPLYPISETWTKRTGGISRKARQFWQNDRDFVSWGLASPRYPSILKWIRHGRKGDLRVKLVIAIIQPTKLKAVCEALEKIEVTRLTVSDAQGFGRQRGRTEMYRGHEYTTTLLRKVALEIVVNDDFLDRTVNTIIHVARTGPEGTIGDGKIFVLPAMEAIQIGDGSRGPGAVWKDEG